MSDVSGWDATLGDFERRRQSARAMGGPEKLAAAGPGDASTPGTA